MVHLRRKIECFVRPTDGGEWIREKFYETGTFLLLLRKQALTS